MLAPNPAPIQANGAPAVNPAPSPAAGDSNENGVPSPAGSPTLETDGAAPAATASAATRTQIRGSAILLIGRFISLGLNFGVQLFTVRYLSKSDYGAFAYALAFVSTGASICLFGLDKAVARFLPIYQERGEYHKLSGTILLTLGTILGVGTALLMFVFGLQGLIGNTIVDDPLAISLLLILIFLSPIQALDSWFQGMFAIFARPEAIFFRRHVLGPGLKLSAVLFVVFTRGSVHTLAAGYLIGGLIGITTYVTMLVRVLHEEGLWPKLNPRRLSLPVREIFGFSTPLLTTDVLYILKGNLVVILLAYFAGTTQVAEFQAVLPVARLNVFVMQSFKYLYTPLAARLFARGDNSGINELYWQTATWIALFSFPIFALSFSLARPITLLLFGERYAESGVLLAILSVGNYFNAAFGFNAYTLRVYGKVRFIVANDILSALLGLLLSLWLVQWYGALGAALSVTIALIIYNLLNHSGLFLGTEIQLFQRRYVRVYAAIALAALGLLAVEYFINPPVLVSIVLAGVVSLLLLYTNRKVMNVGQMFPELLRIPVVGRLLG